MYVNYYLFTCICHFMLFYSVKDEISLCKGDFFINCKFIGSIFPKAEICLFFFFYIDIKIMDILEKSFDTSINIINNLTNRPSNEELLKIYAYYKQAKFGNNTLDEPSMFNFTEKKKWDTWMNVKDMNKKTAMQNYIHLSMILYKKYN